MRGHNGTDSGHLVQEADAAALVPRVPPGMLDEPEGAGGREPGVALYGVREGDDMTTDTDPGPVPARRVSLCNERQNRPVLVARDLAAWGVPEAAVMEVLLRRGVFKWLAVRRHLIRLKHQWKAELAYLNKSLALSKGYRDLRHLRGRWRLEHRMLQRCYGQVQQLCKGPRAQAPDNDRQAVRFLAQWLKRQRGSDV